MADIQVLIRDDGNRRVLSRLVDTQHTAIVDEELQACDLYLVDDRTFPRYRDAIQAHKCEQDPVFCPVVLIHREHTQITVEIPESNPIERPLLVNDTLTAPVRKSVLFRRLTNLLARRRQTRQLQTKNERLSEFASKLRHEFRNPINILDGYLTEAQEQNDLGYLAECEKVIERMERMINDLALILRDDVDMVEVEPVNLPALLEHCWAAVEAPKARINIETDSHIYADSERLHHLIENLFRNAVEHVGQDVTVAVGDLDDGFYVEDDGDGIPECERGSVFEKGYSSRRHGTGLGLALVKQVTDAHGWDVHVTEGSDGGARFAITGVEFASSVGQ